MVGGDSMKVGDLIRPIHHPNQIGVIIEIGYRDVLVAWNDGDLSWAYKMQLEVIS